MNIQKIMNFRFRNIYIGIRLGFTAIAVVGILGINSSAFALTLKNYQLPSYKKGDIVFPIPLKRAVYTSKFTCGFWEDGKTFAQLNKGIGSGPPLPRIHSDPRLFPIIHRYYHDFQPGSYSTALNIFNPTQNAISIEVQVSSENISSPETVKRINIPPLNTVRLGCTNIERILPAVLKGELVEGFFHFSRPTNDISVQAVYTHTTIAAFQEFRGGLFFGDGESSGAGGLGLGGSVDIETVQPIMVGN